MNKLPTPESARRGRLDRWVQRVWKRAIIAAAISSPVLVTWGDSHPSLVVIAILGGAAWAGYPLNKKAVAEGRETDAENHC